MNSYNLVLKYSIEILQNKNAVFWLCCKSQAEFVVSIFWWQKFLQWRFKVGRVEQGASLPLQINTSTGFFQGVGLIQTYGLVLHLCRRGWYHLLQVYLGSPTAKNYRCKTIPFNVMIVQASTLSRKRISTVQILTIHTVRWKLNLYFVKRSLTKTDYIIMLVTWSLSTACTLSRVCPSRHIRVLGYVQGIHGAVERGYVIVGFLHHDV